MQRGRIPWLGVGHLNKLHRTYFKGSGYKAVICMISKG